MCFHLYSFGVGDAVTVRNLGRCTVASSEGRNVLVIEQGVDHVSHYVDFKDVAPDDDADATANVQCRGYDGGLFWASADTLTRTRAHYPRQAKAAETVTWKHEASTNTQFEDKTRANR